MLTDKNIKFTKYNNKKYLILKMLGILFFGQGDKDVYRGNKVKFY